MSWRTKGLGTVLLIICSIASICLRHGELLTLDSSKVIEPYGDGFKSYTVVDYHIKYDSTYSWFEGMNYPYGEHVVPADNQPFISNILKFLSKYFNGIGGYTVPLINFSMLLGIFLNCLFLYFIFGHLKLPWWYAIPVSIGLTFLHPQIHRMHAHYGLTHPEAITITLYLLMMLKQTGRWWYSLWIALMVLIFSGIHFYYFAILVFLITFYFLVVFLRSLSWATLKYLTAHYFVQVLLPLGFYYFWMIYQDPATDRCSMPWGYLHYATNFQGVFTSLTQPVFKWMNEKVIPFAWMDFESWHYVGLIAGIFTLGAIIRWLVSGFRKMPFKVSEDTVQQHFFWEMFLASCLILVFAMGFPFSLPGGEWWLQYTGPIKQFRGIGRFSWIFYTVINIVAFAAIWQYAMRQKRWVKIALPLLSAGFLIYEAYHYSYSRQYHLDDIPEFKHTAYYAEKSGIDFSKYQAIIPIPYFNIGSDNFWITLNNIGLIMQKTLILSDETGLPTTGAMLTRSSLSQTIHQIQLVTEPYRRPVILDALTSNKPFLLVLDQPRFEQNKHVYGHWENAGKLLYEEGDIRLFEIPLASFEERILAQKQLILDSLNQLAFQDVGGYLISDSTTRFLANNFDQMTSEKPYLGTGGLEKWMDKEIELFSGQLPQIEKDSQAVFSIWTFVNRDLVARSLFKFFEIDPQSGSIIQEKHLIVSDGVRLFDGNGWGLLEYTFAKTSENGLIRMVVTNELLNGEKFFFDELLVRQVNQDVYRKHENHFGKNNRVFPLN